MAQDVWFSTRKSRVRLPYPLLMKKFLYLLFLAVAFLGNILILYLAPSNIGFGSNYLGFLGTFMMVIGLFFWGWGYLSLGQSFSFLPKAKKLVKTGAYRFVKHPIYLGMSLTLVGISIAKGTMLGLLFSLFITTTINIIRAKKEEELLRNKFKESYS